MAKILFLHGLESKPGGKKATFLKKYGHTVYNPHLPKSSFKESVAIAQDIINKECPDIIVGSSRGGAVAMCVHHHGADTVLIAPAWKRYISDSELQLPGRVMILHCENDDVVDYNDSFQLAVDIGATLVKAGECHRMSDDSALAALEDSVSWLVKKRA